MTDVSALIEKGWSAVEGQQGTGPQGREPIIKLIVDRWSLGSENEGWTMVHRICVQTCSSREKRFLFRQVHGRVCELVLQVLENRTEAMHHIKYNLLCVNTC